MAAPMNEAPANGIANNEREVDQPEVEDYEFSTNDVFDCLVDKDTTTDLTGFVYEINASKDVGARNQYRLFKFAISNVDVPSKKIYCCVWGQELITKFEARIIPNQIVRITGATSKASKPGYSKEKDGFVLFELNFTSNTEIQYFGIHNVLEQVVQEPIHVDFTNIAAEENGTLVTMSGFLKLPFRAIQSRYGNMSYGNSAITNGRDKVNVNITNYAPLTIPLGLMITVTGILDNENQFGPTTIVCPDIANIVPDPDGRRMQPQELQKGNRFPKRKAPSVINYLLVKSGPLSYYELRQLKIRFFIKL